MNEDNSKIEKSVHKRYQDNYNTYKSMEIIELSKNEKSVNKSMKNDEQEKTINRV
jgi:hypothetical protein